MFQKWNTLRLMKGRISVTLHNYLSSTDVASFREHISKLTEELAGSHRYEPMLEEKRNSVQLRAISPKQPVEGLHSARRRWPNTTPWKDPKPG
jgi:hypothetical protein